MPLPAAVIVNRKERILMPSSINTKAAGNSADAATLVRLPAPGFGLGLNKARKSELEQLQRIERESYESRTRYWERKYLRAAYEVWRSWPSDLKKCFAMQMAKLCNISARKSSHAIRIIIDCSSPKTDEKMKSRWTLALRSAQARHIEPSNLDKFFTERGAGGLAGRASVFEARQRKAAAAKRQQAKSKGR
jgi:hypothetical protein